MEKPVSILFVDDEAQLRQLVKDHLEDAGFSVETADDGDTAIALLKEHSYDLILLDIRMPRMNGIEVLKHIKQLKITSRVIMLTAVDDLAIAIESVKQGANEYLTKPYENEYLLMSIRRVIAR